MAADQFNLACEPDKLDEPKWPKTYLNYDVFHKKPKTKKIFSLQTRRLVESFEGLNSSLGAIGGAMQLVRQLETAGFRLISKYEYIIPWQPRC